MTDKRGFTLSEVLLSGALLALLLLVNLMVLQMGFAGWAKTGAQADILQGLQVVGGRWVREVMGSTLSGISVEPTAMALTEARDDENGETTQGPYARLLWRRYRVYYLRSAEKELWVRNLSPATPWKEASVLESVNLGNGLRSVAYYCQGGRRLLQDIVETNFTADGDLLRLKLVGEKKRYGKNAAERVQVEFTARPRN